MKDKRRIRKCVNALIILAMVFTMMVPLALPANAAAPKFEASANVKAKKGAVIRKTADDKGKALKKVKYNSKLVVYNEVFTSKKDTKAVHRWYCVASGKTKGYIRSDMIKNIKYTENKAKTTDYLYYRVGVGKTMKRKGLFKKGAVITVLHPAYQKGSKERWFKVKVGKNYYYSCATWITFANVNTKTTTKTTTKTSTSTGKSTSGSGSSSSSGSNLVINLVTGETYPEVIGIGCPFSLKGKVRSTGTIKTAAVAVDKTNGTNMVRVRRTVGSKTFDISSVDAEIKFGTLPAGTYMYRVKVNVDGTGYLVINRKFQVVSTKKAKLITNKAFEVAWSLGTPDKKLDYGPGSATNAFKKALNQAYPNRSSWGPAPRVGASCDVFVGTVIRASGADTSVPRGLDDQMSYYKKSKKWKKINYKGNKDVLMSGDVIIMERPGNGGAHTFLYLTKNGKSYIAHAGYKQFYGCLASGGTMDYQLQAKSGRKFYVYRLVD